MNCPNEYHHAELSPVCIIASLTAYPGTILQWILGFFFPSPSYCSPLGEEKNLMELYQYTYKEVLRLLKFTKGVFNSIEREDEGRNDKSLQD